MDKKNGFKSSNLSAQRRVSSVRKTTKTSRTVLKVFLSLVCVFIVFFLSVGIISGFKGFFDTVKTHIISSVSRTVGTPMQMDQYNSVNVLLLGYGGATHQGGFSTDSITVASRNPNENSVVMISVPRDLWIKSPVNNREYKINAIFPQYQKRTKSIEESALGLADKLGEIMGIEIPYYATIDFETFKEVVDAIGGVDIYVEKTIYDPSYPDDNMQGYSPFYIEAGEQHLDGAMALKYARSRHGSAHGDIDRSKRQQQLVMAIKDKMLEKGLNISTATDLYDQNKKYIQTNITAQEMLRTVQFLPGIKGFSSFGYTPYCGDRKVTDMTPGCFLREPDRSWCIDEVGNGVYCQLPDGATKNDKRHYDQTQSFVTFLLTHRKFLQEGASVEVVNAITPSVLNSYGLGKSSIATKLGVKMVKYGLNVTNVANGDPVEHSYITINMVGNFTGTIEAIQTFFPIQDIRVDTGSVQEEYLEDGTIEYRTNRAYLTITLGDDFVLGNEYFSGLAEKKFSYKLDIDPIPPLPKEKSNTPEEVEEVE